MADQPSARSIVSSALPAPDEYDAICAVLMHTERGRWFLQEYARRNRSGDTQVLLAAIQRIEDVVRGERDRQARQSLRSDLLEMAKAITRTRAEVEGVGPTAVPAPTPLGPKATSGRGNGDVFASAERIRDIAWAMRGHGFDPSTCHQLEELAASILSASSLRDPGDRRTSRLGEVLQYLELRVDAMLASYSEGSGRPDVGRDFLAPAAIEHDPQWSDWPACDAEASPPACEVRKLGPQPAISLPALPATSAEQGEPAEATRATTAAAARQPGAQGPLAQLMAMSEIERIALFS
jgi:hypothetical protein